VDHGTKRIGLALADELGLMAGPLKVVATQPGRSVEPAMREIAAVAKAEGVVGLVVGLPLNMDGSEGPQAKSARSFGTELGRITGLPVEFFDERLTSYAAEAALRPAELTRGKLKARVDMVAAAVLLSAYLEARRAAAAEGVAPADKGETTGTQEDEGG
jgi:putative Holliday junction resolvase